MLLVPRVLPPSHHIVIFSRADAHGCIKLSLISTSCRFRSKIPPTKSDRLSTNSHKQTRPRDPPPSNTQTRGASTTPSCFHPNTSRSQDADSCSACHVRLPQKSKRLTIPQPPLGANPPSSPSHKVGNKTLIGISTPLPRAATPEKLLPDNLRSSQQVSRPAGPQRHDDDGVVLAARQSARGGAHREKIRMVFFSGDAGGSIFLASPPLRLGHWMGLKCRAWDRLSGYPGYLPGGWCTDLPH